jgi:hypothetical protein
MPCTTICRTMILAGTVVLHLWPAPVLAQELQGLNLTLRKTHIKATAEALPLTEQSANAFTPTTVRCPGTGTCLLRVEMNTEISIFSTPAVLTACLRVDDSLNGVFPNPCPTIIGDSMEAVFSWAVAVAPGDHEIQVKMIGEHGQARLAGRLLTIQVLKP